MSWFKKINWMKVGEFGGFGLGALLTLIGTWCGTQNAARDQVQEEFKKLEETQKKLDDLEEKIGKEEKES